MPSPVRLHVRAAARADRAGAGAPTRDALAAAPRRAATARSPISAFPDDRRAAAAPTRSLVVNDTRVIPARVLGTKADRRQRRAAVPRARGRRRAAGTRVALPRARAPAAARRPARATSATRRVELLTERAARRLGRRRASPGDALAFLDAYGHVPLPRYIERDADRRRRSRALPDDVRARARRGRRADRGPPHHARDRRAAARARHRDRDGHAARRLGTFEPIRVDDIRDAPHAPRALRRSPTRPRALVASGPPDRRGRHHRAARARGRRAARAGDRGATDLFIYPGSGHAFRAVDHLITNFHLPDRRCSCSSARSPAPSACSPRTATRSPRAIASSATATRCCCTDA